MSYNDFDNILCKSTHFIDFKGKMQNKNVVIEA